MEKNLFYLVSKACALVILYSFTVLPVGAQPPVITSFTPATGPIGIKVTITGSNFSPVAANNIVYFGAVKAPVSAATATSLTVTVPTGTAYQPITVTTNSLTGYAAQPFIVTFAGGGGGPFTSNSFGSGYYYQSNVIISDFDGDGKPDMAVGKDFYTVSIFKNTSANGVISFAAVVDYSVGLGAFNNYLSTLSAGDLDGDGKPDLAVTNRYTNTVSILKNTSVTGVISFAPKVDFSTGISPSGVSIGDLDGDGKPDLAVATDSYPNYSISVLRNTSTSGAISFAGKVDFVGDGSSGFAIGDLNGDGKPELVVYDYTMRGIGVFRNTRTSGAVSFAAIVDVLTGVAPSGISIVIWTKMANLTWL
jgi:hypothetical protein